MENSLDGDLHYDHLDRDMSPVMSTTVNRDLSSDDLDRDMPNDDLDPDLFGNDLCRDLSPTVTTVDRDDLSDVCQTSPFSFASHLFTLPRAR